MELKNLTFEELKCINGGGNGAEAAGLISGFQVSYLLGGPIGAAIYTYNWLKNTK